MGRRLIGGALSLAFMGCGLALVLTGTPEGGFCFVPAGIIGLVVSVKFDIF